ncbi:ABC-2 type transport system permease protein [Rhizobiales bacterium GAS191]|nr:ABC-2 type transport system permease protein [Rhizobiales bacterium GAS191]
MRSKPGSLAWLVAHDLRLSWRRFRGVFRKLSLISMLGIILVAEFVFHLIAFPAASWFGELEAASDQTAYHAALAGSLLVVLSWMTAQALTGSTRALHAQGELDIVLASPVSARNVVMARALSTATEAVGSVAILVAPVIDMNIVAGRTHWLAAYPMLVGAGLVATTIGLSAAVCLFAVMGPRRARLVSQIAATLIGGGFVLAVQIANLLPQSWRDGIAVTLGPGVHGDVADYGPVISLPLRAAQGDIGALLAVLAFSLSSFAIVTSALGERFARTAIASAGISAGPASRPSKGARAFHGGAGRALRRKELLLIARDPWLMSQVFLQIVYVLPIAVILMHGESTAGSVTIAAGPSIVVIASQLSGAFAWLAISGEDAPDLLASAPLTRRRIERGKIEAISLPVGVIVALPLIWLVIIAPQAALLTLIFAAGAAIASACLNLWHPAPGKRGEMMRRHQQSKLVGMVEHLLSLLFAVGCVLALIGNWLAALPVVFAIAILWLNRRRDPGTYRPSTLVAKRSLFAVSAGRASSRS